MNHDYPWNAPTRRQMSPHATRYAWESPPEWHGHPKLVGIPTPRISSTGSMGHGHVLCLPVHHAPLVARPSYPQVHIIDTQCPCLDTIRTPYHCHVWPSCKHAKQINANNACRHGGRLFGHAGLQPWETFSCQGGMELNQDTYKLHVQACRELYCDTLICMVSSIH